MPTGPPVLGVAPLPSNKILVTSLIRTRYSYIYCINTNVLYYTICTNTLELLGIAECGLDPIHCELSGPVHISYIQVLTSYLACPLAALFLLAVFWPPAHHRTGRLLGRCGGPRRRRSSLHRRDPFLPICFMR